MPGAPITINEIADILLVAALIYTAIVWLRHTRATFVVRGMLTLGAAYLVVRFLDLEMTAWIFQAFFAAFVVMIIVIFQEELRQMFEWIAVWRFTRQPVEPELSTMANVLARALGDLARDHVGALVVLAGKDPLDRHVIGGILLDGQLSVPLLRSIFDPHSPGHDGAVLIENGRVKRFAAHLPLSKDLAQTANVGTRHSAALGLAELGDALCLVVSEERGTISIAYNGRLSRIESPQELALNIENFLARTFPAPQQVHYGPQLVRRNWVAKAASVCLAIALWYLFVLGSKVVEVTYPVPITVQQPAHLQIEAVNPPIINVTFSASRRTFYFLNKNRIRVEVDAGLAESGRRTFSISEQDIRFPQDLTLRDFSPRSFKISVKTSAGAGSTERG
jgi:diadenylate cyclase